MILSASCTKRNKKIKVSLNEFCLPGHPWTENSLERTFYFKKKKIRKIIRFYVILRAAFSQEQEKTEIF